jgi:hypothetical protein
VNDPSRARPSSSRRRRPAPRRPNDGRAPRPEDLWRPAAELPEAEPIRRADDATALVRSLGDPPLPGNRLPAAHYLASVVERAAVLATALAASADLLEEDDQPAG